MKVRSISVLILMVCLLDGHVLRAQSSPIGYGNGLPAVDGLGREVTTSGVEELPKRERYVAMFYWTWHEQLIDDTTYSPKNITEIVRRYPEAMKDYHHPAWGNQKPGYYFWEEPLLGYYRTTDTWVLRKHAEWLADAGVDVVFFDCTNRDLTWDASYEALLETWHEAQTDGVNVPKIAFMLPFGPFPYSLSSLRRLYRTLYEPGRYQGLWFQWKGKPCIMAYPDNLGTDAEDRAIADFFSFRPAQPDYVDGPTRNDQWGWLENYPQHGYVKNVDGSYEQVTVGVAQNAGPLSGGHCSAFNLSGTFGRHFSQRNGFDPRPEGYLYGWNFQEQWDRALELDPELVFITGWNEYTSGQWLPEHGWTGDPFSFVDQFDWSHSRDIEPNKGWGEKGDVYYYQMIENIRRFKGVQPLPGVSASKRISLGKVAEWVDVLPAYNHYRGNTFHRDHRGYYDRHYTNATGRNDIVGAKVARDEENLYFYVETADKLTPPNGKHWMVLYIDLDRDKSTGWQGYDVVINRRNPNRNKAFLERNVNGKWAWEPVANVSFSITGNKLEIAIPRRLIDLVGKEVNIEFKWNDNMQEEGNIMDFYVNGDTAPGGRFNFVYAEKTN